MGHTLIWKLLIWALRTNIITPTVIKYDFMRRICVCGQTLVANSISGPHMHCYHKKSENFNSHVLPHTFYHKRSKKIMNHAKSKVDGGLNMSFGGGRKANFH
jgi:hypothetical protein